MERQPPGGRVLIIVPAWNEEPCIGRTIHEIRTALPDLDVLVVDDGSTDGTVAAARQAGATVLELPYNLGVGGAMRAGFRYALRRGYHTAVQVDADGQHDPREVPALLAKLDEADIVIGARFDEDGGYRVRGPRRWAMVVLAKVISRLARTKLTDTTSGFRATGPRALPLFARYYPAEYLGDTVESLVIALRAGCRVTQVTARMRPRSDGRPSHRPIKAGVYLFRAGFALLLALVRRWRVAVEPAPVPVKGGVSR
ncbi:glycosyltransferase family 2 protein [Amycolatopsis alkalitolerans]|uniref:Glycosyltransferase family 2 protein n=1 Tax=Amycolatopsis alkalitolerans TaxID=2547244 RepID=A0A5C4MBW3_9PSEU|nr:glycosyltransferase family 2 protein [Amycolatopsis alkalitolerans]TNC29622.1 glycosyltransferase family 2 protein [Amycolatopsis alkalitolerans]